MVKEHLTRASKCRAREAIAAMAKVPSDRLVIHIRKDLWNTYNPNLQISRVQKNKITKKAKTHPRKLILKISLKAIQTQVTKPERPTNCKTKIWRFHPGGLNRALTGKHMTEMYLREPCLKQKCKSCKIRHAGLVEDVLPEQCPQSDTFKYIPEALEVSHSTSYHKQAHESYSDIDTRNERSLSALKLSPPLPIPALDLRNVPERIRPVLLKPEYNVGVSARLSQASDVVALKNYISSSHENLRRIAVDREGQTALRSPKGHLINKGEKRKCVHEERVGVQKRARFRHRVQLVFASEEGRKRFRGVVNSVMGVD